jgi:preprotein translocase subunit YajC
MRRTPHSPVDFPLVSNVGPLLFLVAIALVMYLLLIRPQSRRNRELATMQSSLSVGDEVMLTSGVYGTIRGLDDEAGTVHVEIATGVEIRVARAAIGQVVPAEGASTTQDQKDSDADVAEES